MASLDQLIELLQHVFHAPEKRLAALQEFQALVIKTDSLPEGATEEQVEILADLAWDLEYYVRDPQMRREDASFYGEDRLEELVSAALSQIRASRDTGP